MRIWAGYVTWLSAIKVRSIATRRLAALGTPWASLAPELRYGTLLLAADDRAHNVRLRVPRTADEARALDRAVFDEQRWTDALHGPHPRARV